MLPPELDDDQRRVVDHRGGPLLVVGGPGTGKTTTLVESVCARLGSSGDLSEHLVLTWSRPAAQDLHRRLVGRVGRSQLAPRVMTFHGFCHALVKQFAAVGVDGTTRPVRVLTAPEQELLLRELLAAQDTSFWPEQIVGAIGTRAFVDEVRAVIARTRQLGMDPDDVITAGELSGRPEWSAVGRFFGNYLHLLDDHAAIDYAELVHRSRQLLRDEDIRAQLSGQLRSVHVDEFCESDPSQIELLGDLAGLGLDVVCFADPSTAVFGFRGASTRAVHDFCEMLDDTATTVTRVDLVTDHRAAVSVGQACAQVRQKLPLNGSQPRWQTALGSPPGEVRALVHDSLLAQFEHIAETLRRAHLDEGIDFGEMAVITRSARGEIQLLARTLEAGGVSVDVDGDEVALGSEPAVAPLLLALRLVLDLVSGRRLDPGDITELAQGPIGGLDIVVLRRAGRWLRAHLDVEKSSDELLVEVMTRPEVLRSAIGDGQDLPPGVLQLGELAQLVSRVSGVLSRGGEAQRVLWEIWNGTSWPERLRWEALDGGPESSRAHHDLDAVSALFDLATQFDDLVGCQGVRRLLDEVAAQAIPEDTSRESDVRPRGVRIVTAHRAKGEQWPLVVVAGVQGGVWPNLARRGTLLEAGRLSRHGVLEATATREILADERRLFHLACSRATERLVVTAVGVPDDDQMQPSRFLSELGVEVEHVIGRPQHSSTLASLVSQLRLTATDASLSSPLRQAAATRLALLAEVRDASGAARVRGADPSSWWGILDHSEADSALSRPDQPIRLQSSQVQAMLECPRQWFLSRQARAEAGGSSAANIGTVVHLLAQHAQAEDFGFSEMVQQLDEVWDQLDFQAAWQTDVEHEQAVAALQRFDNWTRGDRGREVLGVELDFVTTVDLGDEVVEVTGSVDRLERDGDGRLRVVDLKTGRSAPTGPAAARTDQIGIYQLAAQLGAFDEVTGGERRVGGAELVHLRHSPKKQPDWPLVLGQPSLDDEPRPDESDTAEDGQPTWVHSRLRRAARIVRDEKFPATVCGRCTWCAFASGCPAQQTTREVTS